MNDQEPLAVNPTRISRLAQTTATEIELNRLVEIVNKIPALEKRIEELEADANSYEGCDCDCCDGESKNDETSLDNEDVQFIGELQEHVSFRNGTMILEHTKLE
jgi:hypothetical protein